MAQFRLEDAPCGLVSFLDDGKIEYINGTLLRRLGYSADELLGRHIETIFAVGTQIFYQTHFFPLVKLHGQAEEIFLLLRHRDGDNVGMLCSAVRREASGEASTDCVFMEVIERRKFEDALLEARQAAYDANRAKSNFLAVMSHELRTPLNAIGGYVQLLDMEIHGPITDAQKETLSRIERSQKHLLRLINDVLNLARIESGRVEYKIGRLDIREVVASVLPMVEPQIARKSIQFSADVPETLAVNADREKVEQILLNLLTNATKFTPQEGMIALQAGELSQSMRFIRVRDTGIGIPPDMLGKVFEPFVQVESNPRSTEGSGLGLAISRDLARGMGGELEAESELGTGSTFILTLPKA